MCSPLTETAVNDRGAAIAAPGDGQVADSDVADVPRVTRAGCPGSATPRIRKVG